jgi:hypothetical protein
MKYLLQVYLNDAMAELEKLPEDEQRSIYGEYLAISQITGVRDANQLQPPATATTVRVHGDRTLTTDGPFADTKEPLGGYYLFEADDLDAAIELASRIPAARMGGAVEVRPVVEQ